MLDTKQSVSFWYSTDIFSDNSISMMLRKYLGELIYLIIPEDTTDKTEGRSNHCLRLEAANFSSNIKVVFWIAVSIAMSIAIGQLS